MLHCPCAGTPVLLLLLATGFALRAEDDTWVYAVQISATVQASPPQIKLLWQPDRYMTATDIYTVSRKAGSANDWQQRTVLPFSATNYTDTDVVEGVAYEYQIEKMVSSVPNPFKGYGYIYTGINTPVTDHRGKLLLVVESGIAPFLVDELSRLVSDLTGDGWLVLRHHVSSNDTPETVRAIIVNDYIADPAGVKAVFLFGHIPILHSGNLNYDGHEVRPMPADGYYGDMDGIWTNDPSFFPSNIELMVGRVDLFNMPGLNAPVPWPSELGLLRNYLNKDHAWRFNNLPAPRRALVADRFGVENGQAYAASGYRNFATFVGTDISRADVSDDALPDQRWIARVASDRYLCTYGCGGGDKTLISELGTNGLYHQVYSIDVVSQDAKAVFTWFYGSWFGNWDVTDDFMRSILATPTMGLTSCMSGRPHWFCHHMGLGQPIGFSTRLTMNNTDHYRTQTNAFSRGVHIALMGDPTLRLHPVSPPSGLFAASSLDGQVSLSWSPSAEPVAGYYVYRGGNPQGPFVRLTGSLLNTTSFADTNISSSTYTYMVRAVKLEVCASGSYFNPSQGIFLNVAVPFLRLSLQFPGPALGPLISWNAQPGLSYHIESTDRLDPATWTNRSGTLVATGQVGSWSDPISLSANPARYYRLLSP